MLITAEHSRSDDLIDNFQNALARDCHMMVRMTGQTDSVSEFAESVASGLNKTPRRLDCRFLYDAHGSELYECICEQPEYYLTRTEASILVRYASEICDITGPVTLLELGSGCSVKTDSLLSAYLERYPEIHYVPIDVSESALRQASRDIAARQPGVRVTGVNGTYEDAFALFAAASPTLVLFLGSTIGNMNESEATRFWHRVSSHMHPGDFFLLGVDLVKETGLLEAAYNDIAGITESFTLNLFGRMNRELSTEIDIEAVEHEARYNPARQRIETHARFLKPQEIYLAPVNQRFQIAEEERILVEISRKFRLEELPPYLDTFGFRVEQIFTDEQGWFAVLLLQRT